MHLNSLKDLLSVLAPFLLGLFTSYLSDKRSKSKDNHLFILEDMKVLQAENKELRNENSRLRKELNKHD